MPLLSPPWLLLSCGSPLRLCCLRVLWLWPCLGGHRSAWGGKPANQMASVATQAPGRISVPRTPVPPRMPSPAPPVNPVHGNKFPPTPEHLRNLRTHGAWRLHRLMSISSFMTQQLGQVFRQSLSASTAPPSVAKAKKGKGRNPSQLGREFRLQKCFNCGERGHHSVECPHPCYKCDIPGPHSAWCPYSMDRAHS